MPNEDRLTRADLEKLKEFAKKNRGKIFQKKKKEKPEYLEDEGEDLSMSKEGSPTVTDTETGETTFGRPKKFEHGGMASCRGMGKAVKGGKFTGVK
jgi:hypothetical protein